MTITDTYTGIPVTRMSRDIRKAAVDLGDYEARWLVDTYYNLQEQRIAFGLRSAKLAETFEPTSTFTYFGDQFATLEGQAKGALLNYAKAHPIGSRLLTVKGIGPVLAAGWVARMKPLPFLKIGKGKAEIDGEEVEIEDDEENVIEPGKTLAEVCPSVAHFWAYGGVAPGKDRRVKGQKAGWNPAIKRLAFISATCFEKLSAGDEKAFYRQIYDKRKAYEVAKNEAGDYAEQAANALTVKRFGETTAARKVYEAGRLPPGHIRSRCLRYVGKMFMSHLHEAWWKWETPEKPYPQIYVIQHMGHTDKIEVPF